MNKFLRFSLAVLFALSAPSWAYAFKWSEPELLLEQDGVMIFVLYRPTLLGCPDVRLKAKNTNDMPSRPVILSKKYLCGDLSVEKRTGGYFYPNVVRTGRQSFSMPDHCMCKNREGVESIKLDIEVVFDNQTSHQTLGKSNFSGTR